MVCQFVDRMRVRHGAHPRLRRRDVGDRLQHGWAVPGVAFVDTTQVGEEGVEQNS